MLKRILSFSLVFALLQFGLSQDAAAQRKSASRSSASYSGPGYTNALGMRVEFGTDFGTLFGFSGKHFFNAHSAGEAQILFRTGLTLIEADYQYHQAIPNASGLNWYIGGGAGFGFGGGSTVFVLRPMAGLDYKLDAAPVNLSFDWRPTLAIGGGTTFSAGRFSLAARYAF